MFSVKSDKKSGIEEGEEEEEEERRKVLKIEKNKEKTSKY